MDEPQEGVVYARLDQTGWQPEEAATPGGDPEIEGGRDQARRRAKADVYDAELEDTAKNTTRLANGFYVVVLLSALGGQASGAMEAIHGLRLWMAVPVVAVFEFGGVVLFRFTEVRRRLGEAAVAPMLAAFGVASFSTAFNWFAHSNKIAAAAFSFLSAFGFVLWVLMTEARRRDRLRATGQQSDLPPKYEFWTHWVRHPFVTLRARSIAKSKPGLSMVKSLILADQAMRRDRRVRALTRVLRRQVRKANDRMRADLSIHRYDLEQVADELERTADVAGFTELIAVDLDPATVLAGRAPRRVVAEPPPELLGQMAELMADVGALRAELAARPAMATSSAILPADRNVEMADELAEIEAEEAAMQAAEMADDIDPEMAELVAEEVADETAADQGERRYDTANSDGQQRPKARPKQPSATAKKVAAALAKKPDATAAELSARLDLPVRTVSRHISAIRTAKINGHSHQLAR